MTDNAGQAPDVPQFQEPATSQADEAPSTNSTTDDKPARTSEDYEAEVAKLRKENANWRTKLREIEPLAKKAQEAEEANKTEIQKAIDARDKAIQALAEHETLNTRLEMAVKHSIPPDDIHLIGSGSREEMEANAKRLATLHAAATKQNPPPPSDRPVESLRPGATPEPPKPADDSYPSEWVPPYMKGENRSQYGI